MPRVITQPTPNPNSLKFSIDGHSFIESGMLAFGAAREAENDALGAALFALDGVANVFVVPAFVTVTKHPATSWDRLATAIERILLDSAGTSEAGE
ncbi:MAG: scaffolding protein [Rhodothermaceae bacterium]|nr:scaffolding protein [Rhodothermaceae bacterium]